MSEVVSLLTSLKRDAKLLISAQALRSFIEGLLSVIFTIYLSKLGVLPLTIGLLFTVSISFAAVRSLFEGLLADRFGKKPFLLLLGCILTISGIIYATTRNLMALLCTAALGGLGSRITSPSWQAMLSEKTTDKERTTLFSIASFISTLSLMIGSFSAVIPQLFQIRFGFDVIPSYQPVFILVTIVGLASIGLIIPLREKRNGKASKRSEIGEEKGEYEETGKILSRFALVVSFDALGGSFIMRFLSYWFYIRFGVGPGKVGILFGASRLLSAFSLIIGLKLAKRIGTINTTVLSRLPVVVVNLIIPFVPTYTIAALLQVFQSAFALIDRPLRQSYLMGITRSSRRASMAGASDTAMKVTSAVAPTLSGYIFQYISIMLPFFLGGSFQLASALLLWIFFKDIKPPEEHE
ncbi:MFS transporter [Candidatus Bathyarchaeota archaeon]|nr:MFS transporter [Candidatus Bathyarchaeota archaeon]